MRRTGCGVAAALAAALAFGIGVATSGDDAPATRETFRLDAAGHSWTVHLAGPPPRDGAPSLPLVVSLHGAGGDGAQCLDDLGWAEQAGRDGFLVVAPDALPMKPGQPADFLRNPRLWNSGQHPPDRPRSRVDDLAFFDALLDEVARRRPIDRRRVYAVGHSNGGAMAFRLAAERPERFAAVASVAGALHLDAPRPSRPVPTLLIVGLSDPILPFEGGWSVLPWEVRKTPPVRETVRRWAAALGCPERPLTYHFDPRAWAQEFGTGPDDVRFRVLYLVDHGHGWPGREIKAIGRFVLGPSPKTLDATPFIARFLRKHALPGAEPHPHPAASGGTKSRSQS